MTVSDTHVDAAAVLSGRLLDAICHDEILGATTMAIEYDRDAGEHHLSVTSALCKDRGAKAAYRRIDQLLRQAGLLQHLPLRRIVAR